MVKSNFVQSKSNRTEKIYKLLNGVLKVTLLRDGLEKKSV